MNFFEYLKNNKLIILLISIFLNIILGFTTGFTIYKYFTYNCDCSIPKIAIKNEVEKENETTTDDKKIYVEIKGAVAKPGVYQVASESIINDVVKLAGGFTKTAYTNNINLSRKVSNELVVYIYTKNEYNVSKKPKVITITEKCECATYDIGNCTENKASEIIASDKDTVFESPTPDNNITNAENNSNSNSTTLININTAPLNELTKLSGIGESKAKDIISYRTNNGNFKTIEDIKNVSGIGDALFAKIKDYITV